MAEEFKASPVNGAFTTELVNFIATVKINYWIYGHSLFICFVGLILGWMKPITPLVDEQVET